MTTKSLKLRNSGHKQGICRVIWPFSRRHSLAVMFPTKRLVKAIDFCGARPCILSSVVKPKILPARRAKCSGSDRPLIKSQRSQDAVAALRRTAVSRGGLGADASLELDAQPAAGIPTRRQRPTGRRRHCPASTRGIARRAISFRLAGAQPLIRWAPARRTCLLVRPALRSITTRMCPRCARGVSRSRLSGGSRS